LSYYLMTPQPPTSTLFPYTTLFRSIISQTQEEVIQLSTMDNYCREKGVSQIDFLKLDVEGHELEVFKGMTESLSQGRVRIIQFRSEEHTSELQSRVDLVCRLLLEKK